VTPSPSVSKSEDRAVGWILGGIAGLVVIAGIIILVALLFLYFKRRKSYTSPTELDDVEIPLVQDQASEEVSVFFYPDDRD